MTSLWRHIYKRL